jgi:hypothetical protein
MPSKEQYMLVSACSPFFSEVVVHQFVFLEISVNDEHMILIIYRKWDEGLCLQDDIFSCFLNLWLANETWNG